MLLLRSAFCCRAPRRWEIVAFRDPSQPSRLTVKRVVGLPGEAIQIRGGDVYADGDIQRKQLQQQLQMAVLVYDASVKQPARSVAEPRWRPRAADSRWITAPGRFEYPPSTGAKDQSPNRPPDARADQVDWLAYHHQRRKGLSWAAGPVTDELSYNQWRSRREDDTHAVADLLLRFRASEISGDGWLVLQVAAGRDRLEAWIRPQTGVCEFRFNSQPVRRGQTPLAGPIENMDVTFSLVDRQLILTLDGCGAIGRLLLPSDRSWRPSECPLAVGSAGLGVKLSELRVYRDVYYARPAGVLARWGFDRPVRLGPDEYYVLGDNSLISDDSRSWPSGPGVPGQLLVGRPMVVPFP